MSYRIYYAHCIGLYGSKQESRDIKLIMNLFPEAQLVNPSDDKYQDEYDKWLKTRDPETSIMMYWEQLAATCDILVFRAFPDGRIGSGIAKEIQAMEGKPVIELPSGIIKRTIDVDETREYLIEIGQR